jgi:hypothetical protein
MKGPKMDTVRDREDGSIALMMLIMLVATGLILATIVMVERGLRTSRRSGDSANALQVTDAAVNDAMQAIPTVAGTSFTRSAVLGEDTWPGFCPSGKDCYTFTATKDPGERPVWHIDATGTDKTGVQRRIRADAVATSLFATPLYVQSSLDVSSGVSLDSFNGGTSFPAMCTKKGVIATSSPSGMSFGSSGGGGGVTNCQNKLLSNGWTYSMDGCTSYGDGTQALPPMGSAKCPPEPQTFRTNRVFTPPEVREPAVCSTGTEVYGSCYDAGYGDPFGTFICGSGAGESQLTGGKTYYFSTVELRDGCRINGPVLDGARVDFDKPVVVYATLFKIGRGSGGSGQRVNAPPTGPGAASVCGPTAGSTLKDGENEDANQYCPYWSGGLRLRVIEGVGGKIIFKGSGTHFWGAMEAPDGIISLESPQIIVWGAVVSNIAASSAQFTWHYDDNLSAITTTQFELKNWREEAIT